MLRSLRSLLPAPCALFAPRVSQRGSLLIFLLSFLPSVSVSQLSLSGQFDFEFLKGGDGSAFSRNELFSNRPNFIAQRLQLFLDADLEENVTFTAKLQNNIVFGQRLKEVEVQLAYLTIYTIGGIDLNLSLGRILTPFGLFAKRQLSPDNPLIGSPLFFYYQVKVTPTLGYRPELLPGDPYGGLSTMYLGGYYTGAELFGSVGPFTYDVAFTNSPLSLYTPDLNSAKSLSWQGRAGFSPAMFLHFGVSASTGPFMDEDLGGFRPIVADSAAMNLDRYTQETFGFDMQFDWKFYRVTAEVIRNTWNAPYILTTVYPYASAIPYGTQLELASTEYLVDVRIDVPWVIGLYVAGRFDLLEFDTIDHPTVPGAKLRWDNRVRRVTAGVGYKLTRRVLAKVNYDWIDLNVDPKPYLNRWGMQVGVSL